MFVCICVCAIVHAELADVGETKVKSVKRVGERKKNQTQQSCVYMR